MKPYHNLSALKSHLKIEPINTSERFMRLGFEYTTDEGLHAMTSAEGKCVHLRSGVEWALYVVVKQDWTVSKQIYEQFEGGDLLFPADSLVDFAEYVIALTEFTKAQVSEAIAKFTERTGKPLDLATAQTWLKQKGSKIAEDEKKTSQPYNWNFNAQTFEQKLSELGNRIRVRMVAPHIQG